MKMIAISLMICLMFVGCEDKTKSQSKSGSTSAQVKQPLNDKDRAFLVALDKGDVDEVRLALQAEPDLWAADDKTGKSSLAFLVFKIDGVVPPYDNENNKKDREFYIELAEKIAAKNVDAQDALKQTPLFTAHSAVTVDFLLDHHANPNVKDSNGETPIFMNIYDFDGDRTRLQKLISRGADVNAANNEGKTVLHKVVEEGNLKTVTLLINTLKANVNAKDAKGYTPLKRANIGMRKEIAEVLKANGGVE